MIDIPKNLLARVKNGESQELLESYLMNNYTMPQIIKAFAELIITADDAVNKPQILVSEEEMQTIARLFRVRGQRLVDGEFVNETRGRKRKVVNPETTNERTLYNQDMED